MNRYAIAAIFAATSASSALAQTPISGAFPPWSPGTAPPTAYSPKEAPIITQPPVVYMVTDKAASDLRGLIPDLAITKLNSIKGKQFSLNDLRVVLDKVLVLSEEESNRLSPGDVRKWRGDEIAKWKETIAFYSQVSEPKLIAVPSGKPLVGYYKMDALYVGGDGRYPFDSGEYNLGGYAGNARIYGLFHVTLPAPDVVDPVNASIPYKTCRGFFRSRCADR